MLKNSNFREMVENFFNTKYLSNNKQYAIYFIIFWIFYQTQSFDITHISNTFFLNLVEFKSTLPSPYNFHNYIPKLKGFGFLCPYIWAIKVAELYSLVFINNLLLVLPFVTLFIFFSIILINFFNKNNIILNKNKKLIFLKKLFKR